MGSEVYLIRTAKNVIFTHKLSVNYVHCIFEKKPNVVRVLFIGMMIVGFF